MNMFKTYDAEKYDLESAYKFNNKDGNIIHIGISQTEVIKAWGQPKHVYQSPKNNYGADELWIYSNASEMFQENTISYELYFKDNKLIKIIEFHWGTRTIGLKDF